MCYTCAYSLCKGCIKNAVILCVRGNKGFCEACMQTVLLIQRIEQGNKQMDEVDFDDENGWEYLFKDYWTKLKLRLCLTSDELKQAKNPWKGSDVLTSKQDLPHDLHDANNNAGSDSDRSKNREANRPKKRKGKRPSKRFSKKADLSVVTIAEGAAAPEGAEWASKELLEFVVHMKNGDGSLLSRFDVQALLLEYIKRNKLRDPRRKSQIICDSRLKNLFGKARVGHFEMLKLLESHFLIKEDPQVDDLQGSIVDTEASQLEAGGNAEILMKDGKDRKRKMCKKDDRGPQSNLDDYAAIDMHNINLIYLRRNLMEDLLGDSEKFHDKVVGSFARIRISGSAQKQDIYRLVQVVGTSKAAEPYKVGKRVTDFVLEISNLNKMEVISIDIISNQDFTEDECKRLRQSIKFGLINRLIVVDVLAKAMALHATRVNDWLETEIVRLSHLRDRASEKGRRKELRQCVEKLQLLKTAGERQRRLEEIPEVHADPNMDPSHESEEEEEDEEEDNKRREDYMRPRETAFGRRGREPISPATEGFVSIDSWSGTRKNSSKELRRNLSNKDYLNRGLDFSAAAEIMHEAPQNHGRERDAQQLNNAEKLRTIVSSEAQSVTKINETEKTWHYRDPSGKIQGPFSMVQLRKWRNTGYFPVDLRIWKSPEKQDDVTLLTEALAIFFPKEHSSADNGFPRAQQVHSSQRPSAHSGKPYGTTLQHGTEIQGRDRTKFDQNHESGKLHNPVGSWATASLVVPRDSSDNGGRNDSLNLPSPTPTESIISFITDPSNPTSSQESNIPRNKEPIAVDMLLQTSIDASSLIGSSLRPMSVNGGAHLSSTNAVQSTSHLPDSAGGLVNPVFDAKNGSTNLVNFVQSKTSQNPTVEVRGWGPSSVSIPMAMQQPAYNEWAPSPSSVNSSSSFNAVDPAGGFPTSNPWRPPNRGIQLETGPNVQSFAPQSLTWGMGIAGNRSVAPNFKVEIPNPSCSSMSRNPNIGWGGPAPTNMNWGPSMNWGTVNQGTPTGNAIQGTAPGSTNMNWGNSSQGPLPGNTNPGWVAPTGNSGRWGSNQNHNFDRFTGQRGGRGYSSSRPSNRQSSFGRGGGGVCRYYENGHCKKGSSCNYLHP